MAFTFPLNDLQLWTTAAVSDLREQRRGEWQRSERSLLWTGLHSFNGPTSVRNDTDVAMCVYRGLGSNRICLCLQANITAVQRESEGG